MPLFLVILCQGFFRGEPYLYRVQVERMDGKAIHFTLGEPGVVDLGWRSYAGLLTKKDLDKYHPVGNLQVYLWSAKGLSEPPNKFTDWKGFKVTIDCPPERKPDGDRWRLHLSAGGAPGAPKQWVPLEVRDPNGRWSVNTELKKYGIEVASVSHIPENGPQTGIEVVFLAWPANDEIFSWDD